MEENKKEYTLEKVKRDLIINRIISIVTLLFAIAACIIFIVIGVEITLFIKDAKPVIDTLSQVDVDELNSALTSVNHIIDTLKIDEIMDTIDKVDGFVQDIDPQKLETTLDNLNKASDTLQTVSDKLAPLISLFRQ